MLRVVHVRHSEVPGIEMRFFSYGERMALTWREALDCIHEELAIETAQRVYSSVNNDSSHIGTRHAH